MKAIAILVGISVLVFAVACFAGENRGYILDRDAAAINANLKVALHLLPHTVANCSKGLPVINSFAGIIRTWSTLNTDMDAFFIIFGYDSIFVYEYTLEWPAEWGSCETNICGGSGVSNLINTGDDGVAIFMDACKVGAVKPFLPVAFHWFFPTSAGQISIMANKATNNLGVVDCRSDAEKTEQFPDSVFCAGVNVDPYEGPPLDATTPTSWGSIKTLFR